MKWLIALAALIILLAPVLAFECGNGSVVSWWTLDGVSPTDSCDSNNGANNGATTDVPAFWDDGYDFETSESDYIAISDADNLSFTGDFSVRAVYKMESSDAVHDTLFSKWQDTLTEYILNLNGSNLVKFTVANAGATISCTAQGNALGTGFWYDIVGTWDKSEDNCSIWVNGTLQGSTIQAVTTSNTAGAPAIGRRMSVANPRYADGIIDEVVVAGEAWNSYIINNLWQYNNVSGLIIPATVASCNITLDTPANGAEITNTQKPVFKFNLTCYNSTASQCDVSVNSTKIGFKNSPGNDTQVSITSNTTLAESFHLWNVTCVNNTAPTVFTSNSSTFNFTINITIPPLAGNLSVNINVDVSGDTHDKRWTSAVCSGSKMVYTFERVIGLGAATQTVVINETEYCTFGCIQGARTCNRSLIGENPALVLLAFILFFAILVLVFAGFINMKRRKR